MQVTQAIDYLETCDAIGVADMSKSMFRLLRSCARRVIREYPVDQDGTVGGYYDPEFEGVRANVRKFLFSAAPAPMVVIENDPFASMLDLI